MQENKKRKKLKRSESFLGIHFDFHAGEDCTEVGKNTTREMVENILDKVNPDYVQCDCKGHPGFSSYPTEVGNPAPGFVGDPLRIWREVTAEKGVSLYMHYSGVWDTEAIRKNPDWARIDENGNIDPNNTSVFGPYVDELLIPQMKELCDKYGVDGVWVDGECWATGRDYREKVIDDFRQKTGIQEIPKNPEDPYFFEFNEFCREGFRRYLKHYVDTMHEHNSDFQIASNWAYSSQMPEPVTIDVDYISGDYTPRNSVNSARFEGRCMTRQGKPWDLMAWSFSGLMEEHVFSTKSIVQLKQEAAIVLALGGGFQAYFTQKRDGSISAWQMNLMEEVAKFCCARQEFCHRAQAIPQIALVNSSAAYYRKCRRVFAAYHGEYNAIRGILQNLIESQNCVEILSEHHLSGRMQDYGLIIIPECEYLEDDFKRELLEYVSQGGSLLVIGPKAAALFQEELGYIPVEKMEEDTARWLEYGGWLAGFKSPLQKVELKQGVQPFGKLYRENDNIGSWDIAASIAQYGKGRIGATYFNIGERYLKAATSVSRDFLNSLVKELFPNPIVEVKGSHMVDVTLNRIGEKMAINIVNTAGNHANNNVFVFDEIPPVGPLSISIRLKEEPNSIMLEPEGLKLPFTYNNGKAKVTIPKLDIHSIIIID